MEQFSATAFEKSAYRRPVIGYQDDFEKLGRQEVETFFLQVEQCIHGVVAGGQILAVLS